jgi:hypothetical protein
VGSEEIMQVLMISDSRESRDASGRSKEGKVKRDTYGERHLIFIALNSRLQRIVKYATRAPTDAN